MSIIPFTDPRKARAYRDWLERLDRGHREHLVKILDLLEEAHALADRARLDAERARADAERAKTRAAVRNVDEKPSKALSSPTGWGPGDRLITLREVREMTGLSTATIYRRIGEGSFPQRLAAGLRAVRWRHSDIQAWIDALNRGGS